MTKVHYHLTCSYCGKKGVFSLKNNECESCYRKRRRGLKPLTCEKREEKKKYAKVYYATNKTKCLLKARRYRQKEEVKERNRVRNRERYKQKDVKAHKNAYSKHKYRTDINTRLAHLLRTRLLKVVRGDAKSKPALDLLGCSLEEFKSHLEAKFGDGMSWANRSMWHIDHIKPCCCFDLTKEEDQKVCFHYTNMQPLWAKDNLSKGGKYTR